MNRISRISRRKGSQKYYRQVSAFTINRTHTHTYTLKERIVYNGDMVVTVISPPISDSQTPKLKITHREVTKSGKISHATKLKDSKIVLPATAVFFSRECKEWFNHSTKQGEK